MGRVKGLRPTLHFSHPHICCNATVLLPGWKHIVHQQCFGYVCCETSHLTLSHWKRQSFYVLSLGLWVRGASDSRECRHGLGGGACII